MQDYSRQLVVEASSPAPRPRYLVFITIVTLLYLIVELSFNARLLDVVGGMPTTDEVDSIEKFGRIISGAALAIAVWAWLVLPRSVKKGYSITGTAFWLLISGAVCVSTAYFMEKWLIDLKVDNSSAEERYVAVNVKMLSQALVTNNVEIHNLSLTREQFASPEGKTFLALFPLLTSTIEDVDQKIKVKKPELVRSMVDHNMGGLHVAYNRYIDSNTEIKNLYNNEYMRGTEQYLAAIRSIPERQRQAWRDYKGNLRKQLRSSPENVPRRYWQRVRDEVRSSTGVDIPSNWNPGDQHTFNLAVADKITKQADAGYAEEMARRMEGSGRVEPNLHFIEFASSSAVQDQWRRSLHFPPEVRLRPDIEDPSIFKKDVYEPAVKSISKQQLRKYDAPILEFGDGKRLEQFGKDGMRAVVVPPIALMLSIIGALVHIFKFGSSLIFLVSARQVLGRLVMGVVLIATSGYVFITENAVVTQPLYSTLHRQTTAHFGSSGPVVAGLAEWIIQAQPFAYPVNEWVRVKLLSGATFGYRPNDDFSERSRSNANPFI